MKKNKISLLVAIGISILTAQSYAAEKTIEIENKVSLNNLKGVNSEAIHVSADGKIIIGSISNDTQRDNVFRWTEKTGIINIGTLKSDNSGAATTNGMSKDGSVIIGYSETDDGQGQAFRWTETTGMESLNPNTRSYAQAVSDDGKIITGQMTTSSNTASAFIWTEKTGMRSLGTLKTDNSGTSDANGISADGSTIIGDSSTDSGSMNAFRWTETTGMQGLGTLKSNGSGHSAANGTSANGQVVVGSSETDSGESQAFRWTETTGMVGLGTLRADKSGYSDADFTSKDGSIVAGDADTEHLNIKQAFRWTEKTGMVSLGSLKADNSGASTILDMTDNGSVIVGEAYTEQNENNAYRWTESSGMVGLGTLKSDNSGSSTAYAVSADGLIIVGASTNDNDDVHAVLWKIKDSKTPPTVPEIVTVDATNSSYAMSRTANRGFKVLDFYQSNLNNLSNSRCQLGEDNYCVGLFSEYNNLSNNHHVATGLYSALRLPAENWTAGVAINFAHNTTLTDNYDTRGNNRPAVGLFTRYQQNKDNDGLYADLSAAYLNQGVRITRDTLANTEAGEGNATIKGYQARLNVGYGISVSSQTQLMPEIGLSYKKINRSRYTETKHTEFAAQYGRMGYKRTDLQFGMNIKHDINEMLQLDGKIGTNIKLNSDRDAFTGYIPYIGAYSYDKGAERTVNPYASAGINVNLTKNSTIHTLIGWQQTDYKHDSANVGLSYAYHW
ncbi:autotransporter domain-containing protein [Providencia rettgeri]|nr:MULTISPECIES: autotransporter domain-containing protein [Providencia]EJD6083109.1 autotransporter domain-containing protein [Providencia rettgeri]EJD6600022.1 autotransporter domain-containing protein [Providencia rettgeri]MBQ0327591.1 autotransporter domain-containing protein [Providencia rettgeri]QQE93187.1 autotransporter domain-containing protein [Providencia rettgeri]QWJ91650.1 autotransporter domain-containing protein [Providencia rettgeri]